MGFEIRKLDLVFAGAPQWQLASYQTLLWPFHGTIRHGSLVDIPGPETNLQLSCGCEEGKRSRSFTDGQLKSRELNEYWIFDVYCTAYPSIHVCDLAVDLCSSQHVEFNLMTSHKAFQFVDQTTTNDSVQPISVRGSLVETLTADLITQASSSRRSREFALDFLPIKGLY